MKEIRNECGAFWVDDDGMLQRFDCAKDNNADNCPPGETRRVFKLLIPEGVVALSGEAFRNFGVLWEFSLPQSLEVLGSDLHTDCITDVNASGMFDSAFGGALLPVVRIPPTLKKLGMLAFMHSTIHHLYLPEVMPWEYARQFVAARIDTLHVSGRYRDERSAWKLGGGVWHSLRANNATIGRIEWED